MPTIDWSAVPVLTTLAALDHNWRRVAVQTGYGRWEWLGDLADSHTRAIYQHMLHEQRTLTQVMQTPGEAQSMLFAQMRPGFEAKDSIEAFRRSMHRDVQKTIEDVKRRHLGRLR